MKKDDLRNYLIVGKRDARFYSDNEERKNLFLELLNENFPYAIKVFIEAPALFMEKWSEYRDARFRNVYFLYFANKSEEEKREYYFKAFSDLSDKNTAVSFVENDFWKLSTYELLSLYKKWHKRMKDDKLVKQDIRDFHGNCLEKLNKVIKIAETQKKEAVEFWETLEMRNLNAVLLSDLLSDERKHNARAGLRKYAKQFFTIDKLLEVCNNFKSLEWLDLYLNALLDFAEKTELENLTVTLFNHPIAEKIRFEVLGSSLDKNDPKRIKEVFEKLESMTVFEKLFMHYTQKNNKPDTVAELVHTYCKKFPESGEGLATITDYVKKGRSTVNSLPDIIEEYCKKWFVNFNSHNRTAEICSVIEALSSVDKLTDLFIDFSFWKKMENCNAFISIVDGISFIIGFEECFELIKKNYLAASAYEENTLKANWLKAASSIAVHYEEAQKPYVYFIGELVEQDSVLDSRSREIITKETIYNLLQQAADNRKLFELETKKSDGIKTECIQDIIFHISMPMEKLERTILAYSLMPGADEDMLKILRNMIGKIRVALDKAGIRPVVDSMDWEKCKVVPYNPSLHEASDEIKIGDGVVCLSMGMKDDHDGFFEKAKVRIQVEENSNGGNV